MPVTNPYAKRNKPPPPAAAPAAATTTPAAPAASTDSVQPPPNLSDRDHHVLLPQSHVLYVSPKQKGNGVLSHIRNVPIAYSPMVPDYILGSTRCALFLSCKYHSLYPHYIHRRLAELKTDFTLRVLLVLVDVEDNAGMLRQLNQLAVLHNLTLLLAWSEPEAARYLETIKAYDGKDASGIQKREATAFGDQVADFLTACPSVNKSDAGQLLAEFGSMAALATADVDHLGLVPGMGEVKVQRLYEALHRPFSSLAARQRQQQRAAAAVEEAEEPEMDDDDEAEWDGSGENNTKPAATNMGNAKGPAPETS